MPTLLISYQFEYDKTYEARWDATMKTIRSISSDGDLYVEMTSAVVTNSRYSAADAASRIYLTPDFDAVKDKVWVFDVTASAYAAKGWITDQAQLDRIMRGGTNALASILGAMR